MSRNRESTKEITVNDRVKLIRKIHILKMAEKVDLSDIRPPEPGRKTISEIFAEKECWRCGKLGKYDLCQDCKDLLAANPMVLKPEMEKEPEIDIKTLMVERFLLTSLFSTFTREEILGDKITEAVYMNNFQRYVREATNSGVIEKINMKGTIQYKLTAKGVSEFEKLCK